MFLAASVEDRGLIGRHPVPDYFLWMSILNQKIWVFNLDVEDGN